MTNASDYRLYLEEKFAALNTHMNSQFIAMNDKLDEINQHVQKTNGRVTTLEKDVIDLKVKEIEDNHQLKVNEIKQRLTEAMEKINNIVIEKK